MTAETRHIDRSRMVTHQRCPRERFLGYELNGTGIEPRSGSLPLVSGIGYHKMFEGLLKGGNLDEIIQWELAAYALDVRSRGIYGVDDTDLDFLISEQSALLEGMVRGWALVRLPQVLEEFEVKAVEQEFPWTLAPGLTMMMRLDVVCRRKLDGLIFLPDFKGTSTGGTYWIEGFSHNDQVNAYTLAVEETLGEKIGGMLIEGILKGTRGKDDAVSSPYYGRTIQKSPFCYGYRNAESSVLQSEYTAKKGYKKMAQWDSGLSVAEWLETIIGPESLSDLFIHLPVPAPSEQELSRWKRQMVAQERRAADGLRDVSICDGEDLQDTLDEFFPMNRSSCFRFGSKCPFQPVCYDPVVEKDPVGSGFFQVRTPHHVLEVSG